MADILERMETHLATLGYEVGPGEKPETRTASHAEYWNFAFAEQSGGVLFQSFIETRSETELQAFFKFMSSLQRQTIVARVYVEEDGDLAIEAWWPGEDYRAEAFERFVEAWNRDIALIGRHPKVGEFLN